MGKSHRLARDSGSLRNTPRASSASLSMPPARSPC